MEKIDQLFDSVPALKMTCLMLGSYFLMKKSLSWVVSIYQTFFRNGRVDLWKRYGGEKDKAPVYAFITGASDGIGKQFAKDLAAMGFSLVLVARNKDKLEGVKAEILRQHPDITIQVVVMDFTQTEVSLYESILDQVKDLDISILVNNVGMADNGWYHEMGLQKLGDMVSVNMMSQVLITRVLLPKLLSRHEEGKRNLVINLSSIAAVRPMPFISLYSATKNFNAFLGQAIAMEYEGKMDWMHLQPGVVETNMTKSFKPDKPVWDRIETDKFVRNSFAFLPGGGTTSSSWNHQLLSGITKAVPHFMFRNHMVQRQKIKDAIKRKRQQEKEREKKDN